MQLSPKEAWKRILDEAQRELPADIIRNWLEPTEAIALDEGQLVIGAPDQFAAEWNETKHAPILTRLAEPVVGRPTAVVFRVQEERQRRPQMDFFVTPSQAAGLSATANASTQPLNERYTFETFVIGKSNELAAAAAHAIAEAPGKTYNPLFIYGATGLGKTHLMQAIAHARLTRAPDTRVLYVGSEQFLNEVIESIHSRTMPDFRRRYRNEVDLFLVDDVHFLEGKEQTQEEFFHTFNALYEAHKQLVLSSDRFPKDMPDIEERLRSRFEWGLIADLQPPDVETRIAILRKKSEDEGVTLPEDVIQFLATTMKSNIRELEGSLVRLGAYASLTGQTITLEMAKSVLRDLIGTKKKIVSMDDIQETVGARFHVKIADLKSRRRSKTLVHPRQIAMYLCRELTDSSYPEIGRQFGGKDHTTIIHACKQVTKAKDSDSVLSATLDSLREQILRA